MRYFLFLTVAVMLLVIGFVIYRRVQAKPEPSQPTPAQKIVRPPVNQIPISERPYVTLAPSQNGRNIQITLYDVKLPAKEAEYEIEYETGDLVQGAYGVIDVNDIPYTEDILLGSCSAGGKCTYHENVTGGELFLMFSGENEYALENGWAFIENSASETAFSSRDSKFRLQGEGLTTSDYLIIYNTPGLPKNVENALLSAPYSVFSSSPVNGEVEIAIRMSEEREQATILGWDGEEWIELDTTVENKMAAATAPLFEAYVVVE